MARTDYTWKGVWDEGAGGWVEYFGEPDGLPARDLTNEDVAGFSAEQKAKLKSETGQRLYHKVEHRTGNGKPAKADSHTADPDTGAESTGAMPDAGVPEGSAGGA